MFINFEMFIGISCKLDDFSRRFRWGLPLRPEADETGWFFHLAMIWPSFHRQTGGYASRVSAEARKNVAPNGGYATFAKAANWTPSSSWPLRFIDVVKKYIYIYMYLYIHISIILLTGISLSTSIIRCSENCIEFNVYLHIFSSCLHILHQIFHLSQPLLKSWWCRNGLPGFPELLGGSFSHPRAQFFNQGHKDHRVDQHWHEHIELAAIHHVFFGQLRLLNVHDLLLRHRLMFVLL